MHWQLVTPRSMAIAVVLLASSLVVQSQAAHRPLSMHQPLRDKNFYLLSLLDRDPAVRSAISVDRNIAAVAAERRHFVSSAPARCKQNTTCVLRAYIWTNEEIESISLALTQLYGHSGPLRQLVDGQLRSSGAYQVYQAEGGAEVLSGAWRICAAGMNEIISVYGEGQSPRYPKIDSPSFDVNSAEFGEQVGKLLQHAAVIDADQTTFFEPALDISLELLQLNHRDEAAREEPMETGVNQAAVSEISKVPWQKYQYSVIVIPGEGPSDPNVSLDPAGRKRIELAVEAFRGGKAPIVLPSGGYVHPSQTRYAEALEMKKALVNDFKVPESNVIVDPHARHTTTNVRNAVREIYRYGIPSDKAALIISDSAQIGYIASQGFADRCLKELGYLPFRIISRPTDTSIVFMPDERSLEQDPLDPLDP